MSLTEGLLIVAVVILTILVIRQSRQASQPSRVRSWDCVDRDSGEVTSVRMKYTNQAGPHGNGCTCPMCSNPEANAISENAEHFSGCANDGAAKAALDCLCADGGDFSYATNDFGVPGGDFKDWVTNQAVDSAVLKNHAEFVSDRLDNTRQNATGRTYSPSQGSDMEISQSHWIGLRRPQAVAVCNPTQVTQSEPSNFTQTAKFTWSST